MFCLFVGRAEVLRIKDKAKFRVCACVSACYCPKTLMSLEIGTFPNTFVWFPQHIE